MNSNYVLVNNAFAGKEKTTMRKTVVAVLLILAMVTMLLSGCGSAASPTASSSAAAASAGQGDTDSAQEVKNEKKSYCIIRSPDPCDHGMPFRMLQAGKI